MEGVARKEFDFAVVPVDRVNRGSRSTFFGRDSELLISGQASAIRHLEPVRLGTLPPLRLILPTHGNARRERLEAYFAANGVRIDRIVDLDSMLATLELVAQSDFMTIVPSIFMRGALREGAHKLHPVISPAITADFAVIEPRGRILSLSAKLFLEMLQKHFEASIQPGVAKAKDRSGRRRRMAP
jgi:DNA-binding transcriptional LysR family regulator